MKYVDIKSGLYDKEDLKDWCYLNVGNIEKWYYARIPETGLYKFWFTYEEDATAFRLRFGV